MTQTIGHDDHFANRERAEFAKGGSPVDVSVVLVNYNTAHLLERCLEDLRRASVGLRVEVVIVDNASKDDSVTWLHENLGDGLVICNGNNVGFGRANNQAIKHCGGRYLLLLNTDAFIATDALVKALQFMEANSKYGVLGARLMGRGGELQPSCRFFPTPINTFLMRTGLHRLFPGVGMIDRVDWDPAAVQECDWVPGCFYLVRREVIEQVGLFDPRYFLYSEEVDHCRAVKAAGWAVVYYPEAVVVHLGGESAKSDGAVTIRGGQISELQTESELLYFRKHHGRVGVFGGVLLAALAEVILAVKGILRQRSLGSAGDHWRQTASCLSLFRRTGWGTRPTR